MARTPGLLGRKKSNFDPTDPYIPNEDSVVTKNDENTPTFPPINEEKQVTQQEKEKEQTPEKKKFKNQQGSIKISSQSKDELGALMKLTNKKYAHEIIDLLINRYVENELTPEQKMKFKILTEI
ncbi:hypothetical protein [Bacillus pseudomycoides]|uniref:hypothetical protein n=1 Tax=Bacillus pseudomycoides TaxID=64104 RepID=UPI000BEDC795|nr:hypothetical protein [Bacillus pseudomycoides]PEE37781.1 hypothetical protein COO02_23420 [Bacillus pseudomycoides]PEK62637.1 hypothetical protein CN590_21225 [Bacillus pseudomycoides]PGA83259.1 hypothetical protein COL91_26380 [Bacillus pseudomycoides]PGE88210.1 hypothetical protein COM55_02985 [Bacillus pseudomycoides]PHF51535.1 hypothetical protein COF72_01680 [Bacillus pseudomycoides]